VRIDLNADVGEGSPTDAVLIPLVSSVNVSCGAHAGDEPTIRRTVELARASGTAVGAHPSYPDREGFGRRPIDMIPTALETSIVDQIRLVARICADQGVALTHVKPHGALYNQAADDPQLAALVCRAVLEGAPGTWLVGLAGSALVHAARESGFRVAEEAFADRAYESNGRLRSRTVPGALLTDPARAADQAVSIVRDGRIGIDGGGWLSVRADSLCLHGDTPGAPAIARAVREALASAGVEIRAFSAA
jgi:UPF0271 protein